METTLTTRSEHGAYSAAAKYFVAWLLSSTHLYQCKRMRLDPPLALDEAVVTNGGAQTVRDILKQKHPEGKPMTLSAIVSDPMPNEPHPVIFDHITGSLVKSMALRTEGAAGPL